MDEKKPTLVERFATFVVDKRNLFFLLYIFAIIFCLFARGWVEVENDITKYLSEETETRQGLTVMEEEFITYGSGKIMIANISYDHAEALAEEIEEIPGVTSVEFDHTEEHYRNAAALFSITFDGEESDEISVSAMNRVKELLADYDVYVDSTVGEDSAADLAKEMQVIIIIAAIIIIVVMTFTSKAYAEVPVLLITFVVAAILNMGTNFLVDPISFISNSVTVVLQLALAIDYAIIMCHRYTEEREHLEAREACIAALSKGIPEIFSSSLTTISGLAALVFMQFKIGEDLAIVLIKAIFMSLLSVFTLMPGLLMVFNRLMDKTIHKNLVPKINFLGKFVVWTRYIVPPIFVVVLIFACIFANKCPYCYGNSHLNPPKKGVAQIAAEKIEDTFGAENLVALIVPAGNYEAEQKLLARLEAYDEVDSCQGLSNTEVMDGYMLTDALTPREFSELADIDYEVAVLLYSAYAVNDDNLGEVVGGVEHYKIPILDIMGFLEEEMNKGYVNLDDDMEETLNELFDTLDKGKAQLLSEDYTRMLVFLNLPEESQETFDFLRTIHEEAEKYYGSNVLVVGDSTSDYDLSSSFSRDNIIISVLSALFVIVILLFNFKSAGLPLLLILVIQGSIWLNFSFPYLKQEDLYFLSYLIVNAIQMGANIDYAIVISSRYMELKREMPIKEAMIEALNQAFPTILTSGSILVAGGILIGQMTTNGVISAIGSCLGRGTIISIVMVMCVLPQILLLGDAIIDRTSFAFRKLDLPIRDMNGIIYVQGRVRGYVSGIIDANVSGVIRGDVHGTIEMQEDKKEAKPKGRLLRIGKDALEPREEVEVIEEGKEETQNEEHGEE